MEQNSSTNKVIDFVKEIMHHQNGWHSMSKSWYDNEIFLLQYPSKTIKYLCIEKKHDNQKIFKSESSTITYSLNEHGFRTKQFKSLDKNVTNILTAGCSNTFGFGLDEDYVWPNILNNNLNNVNLYNIAISGLDVAGIITNIFVFCQRYGNPEYLFLLLPPFNRTFTLKDDHLIMQQEPLFKDSNDMVKNILKKKSFLPPLLYNNLLFIKNLEIFCKHNNIKLLWHCWDDNSQLIYENVGYANNISFKNFMIEKEKLLKLKNNETLQNYKNWHFADDKNHYGYSIQIAWANMFYNSFKNNV